MASKWPLPVCETDSFWDSNLEKTAIYLDFSGKNGAQKRTRTSTPCSAST